MDVIQIYIADLDQSIGVSGEIEHILKNEEWCTVASLPSIPCSPKDLEALRNSVVVAVHSRPECLKDFSRSFRDSGLATPIAFVNLFLYPFPCLDLLKEGFHDFVTYPFSREEIRSCLHSLWKRRDRLKDTKRDWVHSGCILQLALRDLIGISPLFTKVIEALRSLANSDATVLITGETGSGKDMCARAIHYASSRAGGPFLPINCGSFSNDLFENEFFGHEAGAFTDARRSYSGLLHEGECGSIFLDEIESLSLSNQVKLLRFLESGSYYQLGSSAIRIVDTRIIAATNADLSLNVERGSFRKDLLYRLAVLTLEVPPLRRRPEDIPVLAEYFLRRFAAQYDMPTLIMSPANARWLSSQDWPGNVRQLENTIHRSVVRAYGGMTKDLEFDIDQGVVSDAQHQDRLRGTFNEMKKDLLSRFELEYIQDALNHSGWNISEAARRAGKNRRVFWELMRKHHISRGSA